jgi:CcmD family protein
MSGRSEVIYLFAVYFVLWAITFAYVFYLGARQRRLQRDLELLRERYHEGPAFPAEGS